MVECAERLLKGLSGEGDGNFRRQATPHIRHCVHEEECPYRICSCSVIRNASVKNAVSVKLLRYRGVRKILPSKRGSFQDFHRCCPEIRVCRRMGHLSLGCQPHCVIPARLGNDLRSQSFGEWQKCRDHEGMQAHSICLDGISTNPLTTQEIGNGTPTIYDILNLLRRDELGQT